jgi:hypothetical protein
LAQVALQKVITEDDDRRRLGPAFRLGEGPPQQRLKASHPEIIFGDVHSLERFAAVGRTRKLKDQSYAAMASNDFAARLAGKAKS